MSNMSYCRFQNTVIDLEDCAANIDETLESEDEKRARKRLIKLCKQIAADAEFADWEDDE